MESTIVKLAVLELFGIELAHLEGAVVVYLRKTLGILDNESNMGFVGKIANHYLKIEKTREAATIIVLAAIAFLKGSS